MPDPVCSRTLLAISVIRQRWAALEAGGGVAHNVRGGLSSSGLSHIPGGWRAATVILSLRRGRIVVSLAPA